MTKNFLFVLRKPSYDGIYVQEMLDIILTTAAFEQNVSVLFLDDAVFHLKTNQNAQNSGYKNTATLFEILPTMDVNDIFIETESLVERGLQTERLTQSVQLKSRATIADFMAQFDVVFAG
ncbi:MAG: sulfurtransferase complex subunit TusC [Methylococcaceae bacterium]